MDPFDLTRLRALRLSGPDAGEFLNTQLTADLPALEPRRWHPAAWCDPKGRALAVVLACLSESEADLVVPAEQAESTRQRLKLYTIGRSVEISAPEAVCGLWPRSPESRAGGLCPLAVDPDRWLAVESAAADPVREARWLKADLALGLPWLSEATSARFLPQMLGLEALAGLSYRKGCYPGQEVIARVHYRGRVTRRPVGFRMQAASPPAPGQAGELEGDSGELTVLYAQAANGHCAGLGIVPAETAAGARFQIDGLEGSVCEIRDLRRGWEIPESET